MIDVKMRWQTVIEESDTYRTLPGAQADGLIQWLPSLSDNAKTRLRKRGLYKATELKWRIVHRPSMRAHVLIRVEKERGTGVFLYGIWIYNTDTDYIEWFDTPPDIDSFTAPEVLHFNFCGYRYTGRADERSGFFNDAIHKWRRKNGYEK